MELFVTGIDTNVGKTLASLLLVRALNGSYWKPVQSGFPTDSEFIEKYRTNQLQEIFPSAYQFKEPLSPHYAALLENIDIDFKKIIIPDYKGSIIIEGAGGVFTPLNEKQTMMDLMIQLQVPVILVIKLYLGCINHSLLTIDALEKRGVSIKGFIFNGQDNWGAVKYICKTKPYTHLLQMNYTDCLTEDFFMQNENKLKESML